MKENRKTPAEQIRQLLEESRAENDALKKLIEALLAEEMRMIKEKHATSGSSKPKII
jgi:hypothetical protein